MATVEAPARIFEFMINSMLASSHLHKRLRVKVRQARFVPGRQREC
jgi:hypothetical protein